MPVRWSCVGDPAIGLVTLRFDAGLRPLEFRGDRDAAFVGPAFGDTVLDSTGDCINRCILVASWAATCALKSVIFFFCATSMAAAASCDTLACCAASACSFNFKACSAFSSSSSLRWYSLSFSSSSWSFCFDFH